LNYDILKTIAVDSMKNPRRILEVTDVDVSRLRDDRSEIQIGDEVAFVAAATFRLTVEGAGSLQAMAIADAATLVVGGELLVIGPDGELTSDVLPIDEDSVSLWLAEHYSFTFLLNGADNGPFVPINRIRVKPGSSPHNKPKLELPWLRKLNTALVKDDYIDVDVRIDDSDPSTNRPGPAAWRSAIAFKPSDMNRSVVIASLVLDGSDAAIAKLGGKTIHVPLDGCSNLADDVRLAITFEHKDSVSGGEALPPPPTAKTKPTKHSP
jgi:hypothetical protein